MKKVLVLVVSLLLLSLVVGKSSAKTEHALNLPDRAREVAPGVFSLGSALDVDGRLVQGFMIVKRERASANARVKPGGSTQCYAYLASDAKWKVKEPFIVDGTNSEGLDPSVVRSIINQGVSKWEGAARADVFGDETSGVVDGADSLSPDNKNEVMFGTITDPGVIAVTTVWGVFGGPPQGRYLSEWDQVYNQSAFDWALDGNPNKMDVDNIATHELGHAFGMGHPADTCTEETMYRFGSNGETKKRDLNAGDIKGIDRLY